MDVKRRAERIAGQNPAFQRLLKRIDDELNQDVLPSADLVAVAREARRLALAASFEEGN